MDTTYFIYGITADNDRSHLATWQNDLEDVKRFMKAMLVDSSPYVSIQYVAADPRMLPVTSTLTITKDINGNFVEVI